MSQHGIEVDHEKVREIQNMPTPKTEKEVYGFLGSLKYISIFISYLTATYKTIFKLLTKDQAIKWKNNC